jgi:hypothetical protein
MNSDRMNIKMVNDIPAVGASPAVEKGSELLVDFTTATALILSGVAIHSGSSSPSYSSTPSSSP